MHYLFIIFALSLHLFASTSITKVRYESGISIYGQIGYVDLIFEENLEKNTYKMQATTTSIGMVKFLSSNRTDTFISEGNIKNGVYKPKKFTRITSKNDYKRERFYELDYASKTIHKTEITSQNEETTNFNPLSLEFTTSKKLRQETKSEVIDFYANDFLSLYINLTHHNLSYGKVPYLDMKEKDALFFVKDNLFEVHKNHGEDKYSVVMLEGKKSVFFEKVTSVGIAFYGDAYIKKLSENTQFLSD